MALAGFWLVTMSLENQPDEKGGNGLSVTSPVPGVGAIGGQLIQMQPSTLPSVPEGSEAASTTAKEEPMRRRGGYAEAFVTITDIGFEPSRQTVPVGYMVTFVNDGQAAHWPASDDHPTHVKLPGFDAKRGLATGEEYSFIFSAVGEWGYHDHLNPNVKGVVVVEQPEVD